MSVFAPTQGEMRLPNYVAGVHNELGGPQQVAEHWRNVLDYFALARDLGKQPAPEQLRNFAMVGDLDAAHPWPLDALPFVLPDAEWQVLAAGLIQRTELLNRIVGDLYGPKTLLQAGGLPPALVFGNPRYLYPVFDYQAQQQSYLNLVAYDLGRGPDGQWRVLADWTETPQGLGMCLENRILTNQSLSPLFQASQTVRLAGFFSAMAGHLARNSETNGSANDNLTVILSPGPSDPNYFEHVYLGQYFGYPVVEGADLSVRGRSLQLKTLEGLKPVANVWRFTDSTRCDPLYLTPDSSDGIAGLVNVARNKQVHVLNSIGAGVVENDAFMSFLPGLCERLQADELTLPSIASWWCGQAEASAFALSNQTRLSFGSAFSRDDFLDSSNSQFSERRAPPGRLDYSVVAREPIALSHAPYIDKGGELASGPLLLRLFVAQTTQGYQMLPGGIARVDTPEGELIKDVWVRQSALPSIQHTPRSRAPARYSDRDLPSRTADDLYWLGRYLERCEGTARTYRCLASRFGERAAEDRLHTAQTIIDLLIALDTLTVSKGKLLLSRLEEQSVEPNQLLDPDSSDGLDRLLDNVFNLASQVRERLSADAWRIFRALPESGRVGSQSDLDRLLERLSALNGLIMENMTRSYGWRLLELGRRLERAQFILNVVGEMVTEDSSPERLYLLLELSDTTITYRSRYQALPSLDNVLHLLLLDEVNPRSVIYQISRLRNVMDEMPLDQAGDGLSESQRLLLSAYHELTLADPLKLAEVISKAGNRTQLRRVLQRLTTTLGALSVLVTDTYFSHTSGSGRAR